MLLVLLCGNVALLVFARAATRENEILVRNALGASRSRIISQLFAEALVLGSVGAVAGLVAAGFGLRWGMSIVESTSGELPFWFNDRLAPMTLLYAGLLTLMGAVIAGVVPAFKVTQGGEARLRQGSAGAGGLRFGGIWTLVIVAQIAVTVAFPVTSFFVRRDAVQIRSFDVGFPAEEYLSGRLEMDLQIPPSPTAAVETSLADFRAQFGMTKRELRRRLLAEPGVVGVTLSTLLPHMRHPQHRIEVDADGARPFESEEHRVSVAAVDLDFFGVLGAPVLSGRSFHSGDLQASQRVVVVNQSFVSEVLGSRNPVGRRVRYQNPENPTEPRLPDQEPGPWSEIIGVVPDLGMATGGDPSISGAGLYFPLAPDSVYPLHMAVHVGGDPNSIVPRLRSLATTVDPTLRLSQLQPLDEIHSATLREYTFWFRLTLLVSSLALLISTTGIYSVMSFTVSRRTREIGIRVALGSNRTAILTAIFRRPIAQVGLGVLAGGSLAGAVSYAVLLDGLWPWGAALVVGYALLMMGVCMLACVVPTWRALRIEPTEALRVDG